MTKRRRFELTYEQQRALPCECTHSLVSHQQKPDERKVLVYGRCVAAFCKCETFQRKLVIPAAVPARVPWKAGDPDDDVPF